MFPPAIYLDLVHFSKPPFGEVESVPKNAENQQGIPIIRAMAGAKTQ